MSALEALPCAAKPDLFFSTIPYDITEAKEICFGCTVRVDCLAEAKKRDEAYGVWGGVDFDREMGDDLTADLDGEVEVETQAEPAARVAA